MAAYIYTANSSSQLSAQLQTDKVRISTITPVAYATGNSSISANTTACEIIPANTVRSSIIVGQGNYIAFTQIGTATAQPFSITELGMPTNN